MEKIWLNSYPPGIAAEVDVYAFDSLNDVLRNSCERFADLPAYSNIGATLTYADLNRHSRDFAAYLQNVLRLRVGDRVALMLPNLLQYPIAMFGVLRAGLVVVNVNPQYTAPELEYQLKDSGAAAIVVLENFAHTLQQVLDRNPRMQLKVITTEVGDMFKGLKEVVTHLVVRYVKKMVPPWQIKDTANFETCLQEGSREPLHVVTLGHRDVAFLQYTGGTTGVAKGAVLTHGNMVANLQQVSAWIAHDLQDGKEIFMCPLPLYHVYALNSSLVFMKIGAHTILITDPRDMPSFLHELKKYPATAMVGVNTLYRALLDAPGFSQLNLHTLKVVNAGGMAVQRVVAQRWKEATGVPIIEAYGLTETAPGALCNPLNITDWTGTVGVPFPSTLATILDDAGAELPVGQVGEICIRGPQVMQGYWNRPDETDKVFTADGWLRTGDMGFMDPRGYFTVTDRKKDMIVVSGFKVFPNQVEDAVALHPGVLEVAAYGVPDERSGEAVKIVVVPADPLITEQDIRSHCGKHLTGYKTPKFIEFRSDPLPKTNLGKILRRQLRETSGPMAVH